MRTARHLPAGSCILRYRHQHAKTTYSDAALTTPNANPVVLDAAGFLGISLHRSAKVVLKDANDVQLRVLDPVDACCASEGGGAGSQPRPTGILSRLKTANWTAVAGDFYFGDLSSSNLTMTLPASPLLGIVLALLSAGDSPRDADDQRHTARKSTDRRATWSCTPASTLKAHP